MLPEYLRYTNHSCAPNIFFDTAKLEVVCLRPVQVGEEMTFFYPSSEWDMAQPFECCCGTKECLGTIQGAKYLSDEVLKTYTLTDYIQHKLKTRG
ncbi:MAG: SET domain-containing protein-lysine N-methyltransferase [Chitinophagaceae bacterium]